MKKPSFALLVKKAGTGLLAVLTAFSGLATQAATPATTVPAAASPPWICPQLNEHESYGSGTVDVLVKGKGEWLFRSAPDLTVQAPADGALLDNFSRLNKQLAKAKVKLIVFVAPPRGATMREFIDPTVSQAQRFSPDVALTSYNTTLNRLRGIGIGVPDTFSVFRDTSVNLNAEARQYYQSQDIHWTAYGAYVSAIALQREVSRYPDYKALPRTDFTTSTFSKATPQVLRTQASRICKVPYVPPARTMFRTAAAAADSGGLLGGGDIGVVLVGTSFSTVDVANFSGFLREQLHSDITNYAIGGGGFLSSIVSYLLSDDYAQAKPKFLIWELQYHNLREAESFPLILGAAEGDCGNAAMLKGAAVPVKLGQTSVLTMKAGKVRGNVNVVVELTSPDARRYHLYTTYADGRSDRFDIDASRWSHPANKMIVRLPRDGGDLTGVSIVPDQRLSGTVSAHVCRAEA